MTADPALRVRDLGFAFPPDLALAWHPSMPELAFAANSISLLMPYVEPYLVRTMRASVDGLDAPLRSRTEGFVQQELAHHVQHRRFNDVLAAQCPGIRRVERWMQRTYRWLGRTRSQRFNVAFAAGSETIAFAIARWVDRHVAILFDGVDRDTAGLFLWHLAEEVEHKTAAFDVFEATDGSRRRYAGATALSLTLLIAFSFAGTTVMLRRSRRLLHPVAWFRLTRWSLSLAFGILPLVAASCLPSHHPRTLADPSYLRQWLRSAEAARSAASTPEGGATGPVGVVGDDGRNHAAQG